MSKKLLLVSILAMTMLLSGCIGGGGGGSPSIDPDKPLEGIKIVLDPGHGENYPGPAGAPGEAEVVHSIANKLKGLLETEGGATVYITPSQFSPGARAAYANGKNADIFVSIHANADNNWVINGTESFYGEFNNAAGFGGDREEDIKLCNELHYPVLQVLNGPNRGIKSDIQTQVGELTVLRETSMPACLVEIEYITCSFYMEYKGEIFFDYRELMESDVYQDDVAYALYTGISRYFFNQLPPKAQAYVFSVLSEEQQDMLGPFNVPELGRLGLLLVVTISLLVVFYRKRP